MGGAILTPDSVSTYPERQVVPLVVHRYEAGVPPDVTRGRGIFVEGAGLLAELAGARESKLRDAPCRRTAARPTPASRASTGTDGVHEVDGVRGGQRPKGVHTKAKLVKRRAYGCISFRNRSGRNLAVQSSRNPSRVSQRGLW